MIKYFPVQTVCDVQSLDSQEMLAGYLSGLRGDPEPSSERSRSYWHGWRNGASDNGFRPIDAAQRLLASRVVGTRRARR